MPLPGAERRAVQMNMNNNMNLRNRDALMRKIMEIDFALNEMVLFLDTHPNDKKALALYHKYADKSRELKAVYNENFGPLTPADNLSEDCWDWVHGPWPWEN